MGLICSSSANMLQNCSKDMETSKASNLDKGSGAMETHSSSTGKVKFVERDNYPSSCLSEIEDELAKGLAAAESCAWKIVRTLDFAHSSATVVPDVYTYKGIHNSFQELLNSELGKEIKLVFGATSETSFYKKFEGKPRTNENYRQIWKRTAEVIGCPEEKCGFSAFPEQLSGEMVMKLLSSNPFCTMGMHSEDNLVVFEATRNSRNPLTAKIFEALPKDYATARFCIKDDFSSCYLEIEEMIYHQDTPEFEEKLVVFITNLLYYFELIHATMHVYAYVMLGAANHATWETPATNFIDLYEEKILTKYIEVEKTLLSKGGIVAGGFWPADYEKAMEASTYIFRHLSSAANSQEWLENVWFCGDSELIENKHLLPQARPYANMMAELASQTVLHISEKERQSVNKSLNDFFDHVQKHDVQRFFNMNTWEQWIQCQGMMGITHGNTLTLTRLMMTKYCKHDGKWDSDVIGDVSATWSLALGTLLGLDEIRAINQEKPTPTIWKNMMSNFQEKSAVLQNEFWDALDEDDKKAFGWLLSVWGPNMVGQTQLTITTYV